VPGRKSMNQRDKGRKMLKRKTNKRIYAVKTGKWKRRSTAGNFEGKVKSEHKRGSLGNFGKIRGRSVKQPET